MMKTLRSRLSMMVVGSLMASWACCAYAEGPQVPPASLHEGQDAELMAKLTKEFDADGDGRLNEAEMKAAKEAYAKRTGRAPGGGHGGIPGGIPRGAAEAKPRSIHPLDANGDGLVDENEKKAAKSKSK